jgi:hypothetical protein
MCAALLTAVNGMWSVGLLLMQILLKGALTDSDRGGSYRDVIDLGHRGFSVARF